MAVIVEEENKIAAEARAEYDAEKSDSEQTTEPEAKPQPEVVEPAKEEVEPTKEEEKPVEEVAEADKKVVETPDDEAKINEWALKNGITTEEAREDLGKTKAIIEKYKSPEEIAKALRSTQSAYDKLRSEQAKEKEAEPFRPSANPKLEVMTFVDANKEQLVNDYRSKYPAKTRDMEDDAIIEEVSDKLMMGFTQWQEGQMKVTQSQASQRREQLFSSISESDRRFLPDIKAVVDKTADHAILSKNFNLTDVIRWAKGAKFDAEVKAAEERGYKRAKEEAKIVGIVPSGSPSVKVKSSAGSNAPISDYDKRRAKEMFGTTNMSDDEIYKMYSEVTKKTKK